MPAVDPSLSTAATASVTTPRRLLCCCCALLVAACGGGSSTPAPSSEGPSLAAAQGGALVEHVRALLVRRDAQRQQNPAGTPLATAGSGPALAVAATGAPVAHSNTNVQEAGVDEEDLIKTDGASVYALDTTALSNSAAPSMRLLVHRRNANGDIVPVQTLPIPGPSGGYTLPRGLQLSAPAQRAVALSESLEPIGTPQPCPPEAICLAAQIFPPFQVKSSVDLQFVSLDASGNAQLGDKVSIDGRLVASRRVGNALVLVTTHAPRLAYELLPANATPQQKADELARLTANDVLPFWRPAAATAQPLVAETDCYLQPSNSSLTLEITTITVVDLATLTRKGRCFVGGTEGAYMSLKSVVLATSRLPYQILDNGRIVYQPQFVTDLHKFAFDGSGVEYRASGEVGGHLGWDPARKPYRISEHDNGDLRVLTYTGDTGWALPTDADTSGAPPPSPATLTVLREAPGERRLKTVAALPNAQRPAPLGKLGEQVYAVRFAGERAYLVTFRRIDPLFVLDLSNATDPKVAGELTVPGFSDYLFPLPNGLLFGVGKDITAGGQLGGVKLGLFDVSDAAQPQAIDTRTLGSSGSLSGLDFSSHGINLMQRGAVTRIALPVRVTSAPWATNPTHGLQRIEVDTGTRTLTLKSMLAAPPSPYDDIWGDRSVQIEDKLVFLSYGQIAVADW